MNFMIFIKRPYLMSPPMEPIEEEVLHEEDEISL